MKMLFSPADRTEIKEVRKKLSAAGIRCQIRKLPLAQGVFGLAPYPELCITKEADILKALKLLGKRRLSQTTVIFATRQAQRREGNGSVA